MKIEEDYNQAAQITIFALRGKIDFHELLYSINHAFADSYQLKGCLWDLRYAQGGQRISIPLIAQFYSLCSN